MKEEEIKEAGRSMIDKKLLKRLAEVCQERAKEDQEWAKEHQEWAKEDQESAKKHQESAKEYQLLADLCNEELKKPVKK